MMPVFEHPRCSNCHGGVDPFTDAHRGGAMDSTADDEQCQDCHDQLPGWRIPGPGMFFAGRDAETICKQIKFLSFGGAEDFVEHIRNDHGNIQFIATGYKGTVV